MASSRTTISHRGETMDAVGNPVATDSDSTRAGSSRRTWGNSGMATLLPNPRSVSPEGRPIVGPNQNDVLVYDAVTDDSRSVGRTESLLVEHTRSRLMAAASDREPAEVIDLEASTTGTSTLLTLEVAGDDPNSSASSSTVLNSDTSCWSELEHPVLEVPQPRTPENASTIARQEELQAEARALARKVNEEHATLRSQNQREADANGVDSALPDESPPDAEPFYEDPHPTPHVPMEGTGEDRFRLGLARTPPIDTNQDVGRRIKSFTQKDRRHSNI